MLDIAKVDQRILVVTGTVPRDPSCYAPVRNSGCSIQVASDLEEAVRLTKQLRPTMVLVDDALDALSTNALELTLQIRSAVPVDETPIIIMAPSCSTAGCEPASEQPSDGITSILEKVSDLVREQTLAAAGMSGDHEPVEEEPAVVSCHSVRMDRPRHRVWVDNVERQLTPTEFKLLWMLIVKPGHVLSRQCLASVCKGHNRSPIHTRTIDAHIKSIRRKLGDRSTLIETVHGVGYRFREP